MRCLAALCVLWFCSTVQEALNEVTGALLCFSLSVCAVLWLLATGLLPLPAARLSRVGALLAATNALPTRVTVADTQHVP